MKYILSAVIGALWVFSLDAVSDPEVRYCKNLQTGHVVTVVGRYPCPSGYVRVR